MTDSEIIELLQMQLKTQQQNEFLQKTIESLNQNIETLTEKIADLEEKHNRCWNSCIMPGILGAEQLQ